MREPLRRLLAALALALVACAPGCSGRAGRAQGPPPEAMRTVVDDLGRSVRVAERPTRIVSLAPNLTEVLFAIGAGDHVVADTSYCDYPPEAKTKPHVGDTQRPDLERLIALHPDLVLVSTASQLQSLSEKLESLGVPTYVSNPRDYDGVVTSVERLGDLVGEPERGRALAARMRERAAAASAAVAGKPSPKVFVVVGVDPLITAGKGTFVDDLVRRAGGSSITADETTEWPQYSPETVIARAPDVIVVPGAEHGVGAAPDSLRETPAARSNRVVTVDGDLFMRPGPRLADGLERLARALHPEAFP